MPGINQLLFSAGLSIVLLATASCTGDDPATAEGTTSSAEATNEVRVLDAGPRKS